MSNIRLTLVRHITYTWEGSIDDLSHLTTVPADMDEDELFDVLNSESVMAELAHDPLASIEDETFELEEAGYV